VFIWLSLVTSLADKECSEKSLNVYFYMTPFKKERPTDDAILSAIHVNTGLTRNCQTHGEIVVYRTEEWFKVFVHESMHNFNMDFIDLDLRVANEQLRRTFCIPHDDILLFETYTETWARIINTMFDTYFHPDQSPAADRAHFIRTVREKLTTNSVFYAYQVVKVLEIMGLKYANITIQSAENTEVCRKRYAEDTNVYAYYILGGILSVYALPFISWCCAHNRGSGGRIGTHPMPERRRVADLRAELGDVAIDHPLDVAVELRATNPRGKPADAGKPRGHDLGGDVDATGGRQRAV
jgi:hypothetical protein